MRSRAPVGRLQRDGVALGRGVPGIEERPIPSAKEFSTSRPGLWGLTDDAGIGRRVVGDEGGGVAPAVDNGAILRPPSEGLGVEGVGLQHEGHVACSTLVEFDVGCLAPIDGAGFDVLAVPTEGVANRDARRRDDIHIEGILEADGVGVPAPKVGDGAGGPGGRGQFGAIVQPRLNLSALGERPRHHQLRVGIRGDGEGRRLPFCHGEGRAVHIGFRVVFVAHVGGRRGALRGGQRRTGVVAVDRRDGVVARDRETVGDAGRRVPRGLPVQVVADKVLLVGYASSHLDGDLRLPLHREGLLCSRRDAGREGRRDVDGEGRPRRVHRDVMIGEHAKADDVVPRGRRGVEELGGDELALLRRVHGGRTPRAGVVPVPPILRRRGIDDVGRAAVMLGVGVGHAIGARTEDAVGVGEHQRRGLLARVVIGLRLDLALVGGILRDDGSRRPFFQVLDVDGDGGHGLALVLGAVGGGGGDLHGLLGARAHAIELDRALGHLQLVGGGVVGHARDHLEGEGRPRVKRSVLARLAGVAVLTFKSGGVGFEREGIGPLRRGGIVDGENEFEFRRGGRRP